MLNWQALKPTQVAGTIFNDLDDESVLAAVDMSHFEELFKTRAQDSEADRERMERLARLQARRGTTLIDTNRARNLAITLRKIGLDTESICKAVYSYDLDALQLEYVEMLPNFIPNDTEMKAIKVTLTPLRSIQSRLTPFLEIRTRRQRHLRPLRRRSVHVALWPGGTSPAASEGDDLHRKLSRSHPNNWAAAQSRHLRLHVDSKFRKVEKDS